MSQTEAGSYSSPNTSLTLRQPWQFSQPQAPSVFQVSQSHPSCRKSISIRHTDTSHSCTPCPSPACLCLFLQTQLSFLRPMEHRPGQQQQLPALVPYSLLQAPSPAVSGEDLPKPRISSYSTPAFLCLFPSFPGPRGGPTTPAHLARPVHTPAPLLGSTGLPASGPLPVCSLSLTFFHPGRHFENPT